MSNVRATDTEAFLKKIAERLVDDDCGIELDRIGKLEHRFETQVDLNATRPPELDEQEYELSKILNFLHSRDDESTSWLKINVIDQAINWYVGIGVIPTSKGILGFALNYLWLDRADQSGDTIIVLIGKDWKWAVSFTLSQDSTALIVEKFGQ